MKMKTTALKMLMLTTFLFVLEHAVGVEYPGPTPGPADAVIHGNRISAGNQALIAAWIFSETGLSAGGYKDIPTGAALEMAGDVFQVVLGDETTYRASAMKPLGPPVVKEHPVRPDCSRLAGRVPGKQIELPMISDDGRLRVVWRAVILEGSNYVRQVVELSAAVDALTIREIIWLKQPIPNASNAGSVDGSLVVAGPFFFGCEDPMAENRVLRDANEGALCRLKRDATLAPGELLTQGFVVGVAPQGQLRRSFLHYLERERAHPYRPYLHYNSWYDIAWQPFALNEENCLEAIQLFGERFIKPHHVVMDALVFDDGWDDPETLWQFHRGFPHGFEPLAQACRRYGTRLGVWLSPFGGYGEPRQKRLTRGREQGYEVNQTGFSLAGPKYYQAFKQACVQMIRRYGVNHFKFDGIATGMQAQGAGEYVRDTEAMRRLMLELRQEDPSLYINLTTGSWPSPFWLRYADSVWRQGHDMGFAGPGSKQQQWLTYRDQETYRNIVCRGPLYPLNSLMTQGVAYSRQGSAGDPTFNSAGFKDDVHAFFGSGTGLQELYIQPGRLTDDDWTVLAEAARWSRANADVLVDTHWIGGDPSTLEVYGFASWSPRKGIVMLRNPGEQPQQFLLDVGVAFELPVGATSRYTLKSPWAEDVSKPALSATAGMPKNISLQPFEVAIWDATPARE